MIIIDKSSISNHIEALKKIGNLGDKLEDGFFRAPWSDEESKAFKYFVDEGNKSYFSSNYDEVGNLFLRIDGNSSETIQIGSHLDTVPKGGLFDGGAGIVAGFEAIKSVKEYYGELNKNLELVIWRGEEAATFGSVYMGSSSAFGIADPNILNLSYQGKTLSDAISSQGFSTESIKHSRKIISQEKIDSIIAHFELHIEQGTVLEENNKDIGIVTSIRSSRRFKVIIRGQSAHSGATPMGTKYRKDAVLTFAYIQTRLNEAIIKANDEGADLVQTIGIVNNYKTTNNELPEIFDASITKVSELCYFYLDIRSNKKNTLDNYQKIALSIIKDTVSEFNTSVEISQLSFGDPIESLNEELQEALESSCDKLNYPHIKLPSGGGHDAGIVSKQIKSNGKNIPAAMIFIPCRKGISHNPLEFTSIEAIKKGAEVLAETLIKLQ